jgi:hypothetical protein
MIKATRKFWKTVKRFRTWIVNSVFGVLIGPEAIAALLGYDWGAIIPEHYMPYVTLAVVVLNVWMRPRPAVLASDIEANS